MLAMPRLAIPAGMPKEVLAIIDVIGNNVRTEVLRCLSVQPMTAVELGEALEMAASSLHRHLTTLEERGLVRADVRPGQRRGGRTVTWSADREQVLKLAAQWGAYATGDEPTAG